MTTKFDEFFPCPPLFSEPWILEERESINCFYITREKVNNDQKLRFSSHIIEIIIIEAAIARTGLCPTHPQYATGKKWSRIPSQIVLQFWHTDDTFSMAVKHISMKLARLCLTDYESRWVCERGPFEQNQKISQIY